MVIWQQIVSLLTETPGNVVYHLVTLFSLQAALAISAGQWLRDNHHRDAWRGLWAAGFLIGGRLFLLAAALLLGPDPTRAALYLPLMEQAVNMATAVFIVWAFAPPPAAHPRLPTLLLLLSLLTITLVAISFSFIWQAQIGTGITYSESAQALFWAGGQTAVYALGLALTLANRHTRASLAPLVLAILLTASVAALFLTAANSLGSDTHIIFWARLGYLVAFPLWAVLAYQQSLAPLVAAQQANQPVVTQLTSSLRLSADILSSLKTDTRIQQAVMMVPQILDAAFIGVGVLQPENKQIIRVTSNLPQTGANAPRSWQIDLVEWAPFRTAIRKREGVELLAEGQGGRHLRALYEALEIGAFGAMLVQPMFAGAEPIGLLLLAKPDGRAHWSERDKAVAPALAALLAQAIRNAQQHHQALLDLPAEPPPPLETAVSGRVISLEAEVKKLSAELTTATNRANQAEARAVVAMKRAHDLGQALAEIEKVTQDDRVHTLQEEIDILRQALHETEEALAMAAAGEAELSAEWVMMTITRYSGLLEESQTRINALEAELARYASGEAHELIIALIQELRTPLTSIAGFSDLLLGETLGILGTRQRDLLQRIQANAERLEALLGQILQVATQPEQLPPADRPAVNVQQVIETAVTGIMTQVREKNLRLDLNISHTLPSLPIKAADLQQMVAHLLGNACQATGNNGRIHIAAHAETIQDNHPATETFRYLQIDVTDSGGGVHPDDLSGVFAPHHRADAPLIKGLGDTSAGLAVAQQLALHNGGRIWVNSDWGQGTTFSILLPLPAATADEHHKANGAGAVPEAG